MSKLLDDLIQQSRTDTAAYEEFLRKAEELVKRLAAKQPEDGIPAELHGKREATVIYNNLETILAGAPPADVLQEGEAGYGNVRALLALEIDRAMRLQAPADWKGDETKERVVQNFLFPLLKKNRAATLALFELVKNQPGY
jgi:type I restriction enzyme R subunit